MIMCLFLLCEKKCHSSIATLKTDTPLSIILLAILMHHSAFPNNIRHGRREKWKSQLSNLLSQWKIEKESKLFITNLSTFVHCEYLFVALQKDTVKFVHTLFLILFFINSCLRIPLCI